MFSCNYCGKGGSAARALTKKNNISEDEAWKLLDNGGRSTYRETLVFEGIKEDIDF